MDENIYIPQNIYIDTGYYSRNDLYNIIRHDYANKELVFFVLDMLEE
jgi:hypothetical protein